MANTPNASFCTACGAEVASGANVCSNCGAKLSKPITKKPWFWIVIVVLVLALGGSMGGNSSSSSSSGSSSAKPDESTSVSNGNATLNITGGSATPSRPSAGKEVTIKAAKAEEGKVFDGWQVTEGDVSLADASAIETTFTMIDGTVSIEAVYRDADQTTTEGTKYADKFTLSTELTSDGYWSYIEGTIVNNSGKDLEYLQVEFTLYDSDGTNIGSAWDNASNVGKGETVKIKAIILADEDVDYYKFADISAW